MQLITKYITKCILSSIMLVTLLLAALQIFILFINQLNIIGHGEFTLWEAAYFVLLQTPYQVYLFFPVVSLLGVLIGLGVLANNHELIVMRANGMSILQITRIVLSATLILVIIVTALGETLVPFLMFYSKNRQIQALSSGQALRTENGIWMRYKNDFININTIKQNNILNNVLQLHFNKNYNLISIKKIQQIIYKNGQWHAVNINKTIFKENKIKLTNIKKELWPVIIKPTVLQLSGIDPDNMNLHELNQYIRDKQQQHQLIANYQLVFWQRILQPLSTLVIVFLAVPFIFGSLRSATMGLRFIIGAAIGFGFHVFNHLFGSISQVYQISPLLSALLPIILFGLLGVYLMYKIIF